MKKAYVFPCCRHISQKKWALPLGKTASVFRLGSMVKWFLFKYRRSQYHTIWAPQFFKGRALSALARDQFFAHFGKISWNISGAKFDILIISLYFRSLRRIMKDKKMSLLSNIVRLFLNCLGSKSPKFSLLSGFSFKQMQQSIAHSCFTRTPTYRSVQKISKVN